MTWPQVQFVESPDEASAIRYDFNDAEGVAVVLADGWSLGVSSLSGDPDGISVDFGFRELSFTQEIRGSRLEALSLLNALSREVLRRRNWLRFQLDSTTDPVWFHTYRSLPDQLVFDHIYVDADRPDRWSIGVKLDADSWAVGAEVSHGPVEYHYDYPANTPWLGFFLPQIKGDIAVPLRVAWAKSSGSTGLDDGFLAVSPTATQSRTVWTFPSPSTVQVVKAAAPSDVPPGRYRVLSVYPSGAGGDHRFGVSYDGGTTPAWLTDAPVNDYRTLSSAHDWADLGILTVGSSDGDPITPYIWYDWTGTSGADVAVILVPLAEDAAGEPATVMDVISGPSWAGSIGGGQNFLIDDSDDHDHQSIRGSNVLPAVVKGASQIIGHPQLENLVTILGDHPGGAELTFKYRPRYLNLAGD